MRLAVRSPRYSSPAVWVLLAVAACGHVPPSPPVREPRPNEEPSAHCPSRDILHGFGVTEYVSPWISGPPHRGIDIIASADEPVLAMADGSVVRAALDEGGVTVDVFHEQLGILSRYGHLSTNGLRVGDLVQRSQQLGVAHVPEMPWVSHVHFEIRGDQLRPIDPLSKRFECTPSPDDLDALQWPVECKCRKRQRRYR
jgi:murein DD-endopeptidase MepM/ murein hydrolase activator NlpD